MQIKYFLSLLPLIAVSASLLPSSDTPSDIPSDHDTPKCPQYCTGTAYNASLTRTYVCGDSRLGPRRLPRGIVLGDLVNTYDRFGGLCPGQFLDKWYDPVAVSYIYPPQAGFQLATTGTPIEGTVALPVGFLIDRFGSEYGAYTSPKGAPYMQRALPPSNLDTPQSSPVYPYNYHVYNVTKSFTVTSGPIAGWFGQPGQGVQYQMSSNVMTLLAGGFLERVALE